MADHAVESLIEKIVAGAHIPSRTQRDELRRELLAHFEDAGTTPETLRDALRRFGSEALITESLRRVYRWDYTVFLSDEDRGIDRRVGCGRLAH